MHFLGLLWFVSPSQEIKKNSLWMKGKLFAFIVISFVVSACLYTASTHAWTQMHRGHMTTEHSVTHKTNVLRKINWKISCKECVSFNWFKVYLVIKALAVLVYKSTFNDPLLTCIFNYLSWKNGLFPTRCQCIQHCNITNLNISLVQSTKCSSRFWGLIGVMDI